MFFLIEIVVKLGESREMMDSVKKAFQNIEEILTEEFSWKSRNNILSFRHDILEADDALKYALDREREELLDAFKNLQRAVENLESLAPRIEDSEK